MRQRGVRRADGRFWVGTVAGHDIVIIAHRFVLYLFDSC
jgi:hypothetical protein